VVKKEGTENDATICNGQNYVDPKIAVGEELTEIANITHAGFSSWEQSMYFQHADKNLKQQLANAHIHQEIMHLESEMEQVQEAKNKKRSACMTNKMHLVQLLSLLNPYMMIVVVLLFKNTSFY